jgi:hypothetical protein
MPVTQAAACRCAGEVSIGDKLHMGAMVLHYLQSFGDDLQVNNRHVCHSCMTACLCQGEEAMTMTALIA